MEYKVIYADPPWMEDGRGKCKRGADKHYPLMKTKDIIDLMKNLEIADDAYIFLWVTNNFLKDGLMVLESLDFKYITMITWVKPKFGLGQYFRGQTEHCLFGKKGVPKRKTNKDGSIPRFTTMLSTDSFFESTRTHSRKPDKMRRWIEAMTNGPRLEVFARQKNDGWDVFGNDKNIINENES